MLHLEATTNGNLEKSSGQVGVHKLKWGGAKTRISIGQPDVHLQIFAGSSCIESSDATLKCIHPAFKLEANSL